MVEGPNFKVVKSSQLGNCWSAVRFCGGRCQRIEQCNYPEKKTCLAVDSEIKVLEEQLRVLTERHISMIMRLKAMKDPDPPVANIKEEEISDTPDD